MLYVLKHIRLGLSFLPFNLMKSLSTIFQYVFQPGQMQPNSLYEGRTEEGVAILSKFPVVAYSHKFLFRFVETYAFDSYPED